MQIYRDNLEVLWAVHLADVDPEAAQRLNKCRDTIVKAQKLSDGARYTRSNTLLLELLSMTNNMTEDRLTNYYGKVCGLLGWNYFQLHDGVKAAQWIELAARVCARVGDLIGLRIYEENLAVVRKKHADK